MKYNEEEKMFMCNRSMAKGTCYGAVTIYRPWITVNGVRIYAVAYGKEVFKIPLADK